MDQMTVMRRAWRGILETDFYAFLERAFRDIDQRHDLVPAPYIELLTEAFDDVARGKDLRSSICRRGTSKA